MSTSLDFLVLLFTAVMRSFTNWFSFVFVLLLFFSFFDFYCVLLSNKRKKSLISRYKCSHFTEFHNNCQSRIYFSVFFGLSHLGLCVQIMDKKLFAKNYYAIKICWWWWLLLLFFHVFVFVKAKNTAHNNRCVYDFLAACTKLFWQFSHFLLTFALFAMYFCIIYRLYFYLSFLYQ